MLKEDKQRKWEYVKMLPHVWNNTKQIRFFADDYDDMKEISTYLEEDLNNRLQYKDKDYKDIVIGDIKKYVKMQEYMQTSHSEDEHEHQKKQA